MAGVGGKLPLRAIHFCLVRWLLSGRTGAVSVAALLALQLVLLYLSLGPLDTISAFCAGPGANLSATIIGGVHLAFVALFIVGLLALRFTALQAAYTLLLVVGLCALPVQAHLVSIGELRCDAP